MKAVAISGVGVLSPLGDGLAESVDALIRGEGGLVAPGDELRRMGICGAGRVRLESPGDSDRAEFLAVEAGRQALRDAGLRSGDLPERSLVCVSASKGAIHSLEAGLRAGRLEEGLYPLGASAPALALSRELMSVGPAAACAAACASGMVSILTAVREVSSGRAELALAGAAESSLTPFVHAGFQRMGALVSGEGDPSRAVRPFDTGRMGFLLGEGAAVLVIESADRVARRGASARAVVAGCAAACDAYDQVAPEPSGAGERAAAELALRRSGLEPGAVGGIWLHGTATLSGDPAELKALDPLGRAAGGGVPATASKGATGHMLGASGAVEVALAVGCLERGVVPAVTNLRRPIGKGTLVLVRGDPGEFREPNCLVLSAGFGGHCGAVVLEASR